MRDILILILVTFSNSFFSQYLEIGSVAPRLDNLYILKNSNFFNYKDINDSNKIIVLEFWASWCKPCLKSINHTNNIIDDLTDKNQFVFISLTNENPVIIKKIIEKLDFKTIVCTDTTNNVHKKYGDNKKGIMELPYVYIIKNDTIRWKGNVFDLNSDILLNQNFNGYSKANKINMKIDNESKFDFNYFMERLSMSDTNTFHIRNSYKYDFKFKKLNYSKLFVKSLNLLQIYNKIFGYNKNIIEIDERLNSLYFDIVNLSNDNERSRVELENRILSYAKIKKTKKTKSIEAYDIDIKLEKITKSTINANTIRIIDGMYYLFGYNISDLIHFLNSNSDFYFCTNSNSLNRFDFVIELRDLINSLQKSNIIIRNVSLNVEILQILPN